mmetsp:Transcript_84530/g.167827  ORF Transcript_84530/g.167827 Transcript_84530/m.167827 type:complete len:218 (-) Transcript_84530:97-750(-)
MDAFVLSMSALRVSIVFSRSAIFISRLTFLSSAAAVSRSLFASSSLHQSRCLTSSACCVLSSATILSMASLTLVKASSSAAVARDSMSASLNTCAARWRRNCSSLLLTDEVCKKAVFTVLSKLSNASSELRILMVSCTAMISSVRSFTRVSYSASDSVHFFFNFARNSRSMPNCDSTSSNSCAACTSFSLASAICTSIASTAFFAASISSNFAALRA